MPRDNTVPPPKDKHQHILSGPLPGVLRVLATRRNRLWHRVLPETHCIESQCTRFSAVSSEWPVKYESQFLPAETKAGGEPRRCQSSSSRERLYDVDRPDGSRTCAEDAKWRSLPECITLRPPRHGMTLGFDRLSVHDHESGRVKLMAYECTSWQ